MEFDVQLARDAVPVVIHDADLRRTAGLREAVGDLTSVELAKVDVGSWFNSAFPSRSRPEFASETVRTLSDTLALFTNDTARIYIEIKGTPADVVQLTEAVCTIVRDSPLQPQIIVKSFTLSIIPLVRVLCPGVRTAALFEPTLQTVVRKRKNIIDAALAAGADEISLHYSLATPRLCSAAAAARLPVTVWTVNDVTWRTRSAARSIAALITNDPAAFTGGEGRL